MVVAEMRVEQISRGTMLYKAKMQIVQKYGCLSLYVQVDA